MVPASRDEAGLGVPAHGEGFSAVEHPGPVDTVVELCGEVGDSAVIEIGAGGEDTAEKDGSVDGRYFDVDEGFAGFDIAEVIEEAVLVGHLVEMKVERGDDLLLDPSGVLVAALVGDTESAEAIAGGGDAGGEVLVEFSGCVFVGGAVEDLSGGWVCLLGEVETACSFHLFEEGEVFVA